MICGKTFYNSQREAIEAIKGMLGDRSHKIQPSRAYFCEPCNGYHIYTENFKKGKKGKQRHNKETDSKPEAQKANDRKFKELIIHDPRKFKVK